MKGLEERLAFDQYLRLIRASAHELRHEIGATWGDAVPPSWRSVAAQPRPWLDSLTRWLHHRWSALSARWNGAEALLRREERRVGIAVVTGAASAALESISPNIHRSGGTLRYAADCGTATDLTRRRLILVPMLTSSARPIVGVTVGGAAVIAYPVPRRLCGSDEDNDDGADRAALVLGQVRASMLRMLDSPKQMQTLADILFCTPSNLTYHCAQLRAAGLISRQRRGRAVWVARTERAAELLEALDTLDDRRPLGA